MARGYQSYRGRRSKKNLLVVVLLAVILVAALVFWFVQSTVTYTDDGQIRISLPFRREDGGSGEGEGEDREPEPPTVDVQLTVGDPEELGQEGGAESEGAPEPSPAPEPEPAPAFVRHLLAFADIPQDAGALEQAVGQAGAEGFMVTVRDDTGRVYYTSAAAQTDAAEKAAVSAEGLAALCAGGRVAAARFNCFHDSYFAFVNMKNAGICQGNGYIWYDSRSYHWLDPDKDDARAYVISLAVECAQLGFDELVLEEMCYPTSGKLQKIDYSGNTRTKPEALGQFLTELRTALEPYGTKVALLLSEEAITSGGSEESGVDLAALLPKVDAVYAQVADAAAAQARLAELCPENTPVLVALTAAPGAGDYCILPG